MKLLKSRHTSSHHDKQKKKTKSKTSKASQDAIDEHVDTEVTYFAGESFKSIASSVTSPPSMTASFYAKALNGWEMDDEDDCDDDDLTASGRGGAPSEDGSDNHWGGGASIDSRSVDMNSEDGCNGSKSSKGSKGSKGKKKQKKEKKKFRLGGKKKNILAKDAIPKQETVMEESFVASEGGFLDHDNDLADYHSENRSCDRSPSRSPVRDADKKNKNHDYRNEEIEEAAAPKPVRKSGRRSSMGDMASPEEEKPVQKPNRRRNSLLGNVMAAAAAAPPPPKDDTPKRNRKPRRNSMFGGISKSTHSDDGDDDDNESGHNGSQQQPTAKQRRRRSLFGSSTADTEASLAGSSLHSTKIPKDLHKYVNQERVARGMEPFHRNMLLDTLAQSLATDLSVGRPSGGCDYHGNVGQGVSLQIIHTTLMENRSGPARKNILSTRFTEFGMAVVQGRNQNDGILYMCQLFK